MEFNSSEITIISLVSGLIGSLITVGLTALINLRQARNQHQYNLEEIFFRRKLDISEKAVSQYHEIIVQCLLLEKYLKQGLKGGPSHAAHINQVITDVFNKISAIDNRKDKVENSDMIYFNQEFDKIYGIAPLDNMMKFTSKISALQDDINSGKYSDGNYSDEILHRTESAFEDLGKSIHEMRIELKRQIEFIYNDFSYYRNISTRSNK
jgi:hypothetical protein